MSHSLGHSITTQDVDLTGSPSDTTRAKIVDVTIPTGKVVVGAGALLTHVGDGSSNTTVYALDSLTGWQQYAKWTAATNGPHPTDTTLWRFVLRSMDSNGYGYPARFRVWIITADPD